MLNRSFMRALHYDLGSDQWQDRRCGGNPLCGFAPDWRQPRIQMGQDLRRGLCFAG